MFRLKVQGMDLRAKKRREKCPEGPADGPSRKEMPDLVGHDGKEIPDQVREEEGQVRDEEGQVRDEEGQVRDEEGD